MQRKLKLGDGFSWEEVMEIALNLGRALCYLEINEILHYDLRPSKLIYQNHEKVQKYKFFDLGLAQHLFQIQNKCFSF